MKPVYDLEADVEFEEELDWREVVDPDGKNDEALDNDDEDQPTPEYVIDALGFDPDKEDW
ncbi:MAG: hypothetical protein VW739_05820 [Pelagibacteraceae bacterium]